MSGHKPRNDRNANISRSQKRFHATGTGSFRLEYGSRLIRGPLCALLVFVILLPLTALSVNEPAFAAPVQAGDGSGSFQLHVSAKPDRSKDNSLRNLGVVRGKIHVFVTPPDGIAKVRFFVDLSPAALEDPTIQETPSSTDNKPPFDFNGSDGTQAKPYDTRQLPDGQHSITAAIDLNDGTTEVVMEEFIVHNGAPALLFREQELEVRLPAGGTTSKAVRLLTSNDKAAKVTVTDNASWLSIERPPLSTSPNPRVAPETQVLAINTAGLSPGTHTATITATSPDGFTSDSLTVSAAVEPPPCSPVACEEILVDLPYGLSFSQNHGKILDRSGVGTGFTYIDQPTNGIGYIPQNLRVNTANPGSFTITTTSGIANTTTNSQDNTLGVGIDAPSQITIVNTTVLSPPAGTGKFEQGGLWFGNDEDNYVKLVVISTSSGTQIQYLMEVGGVQSASRSTASLNLAGAAVDLTLKADPNNRSITASYSVSGGATTTITQFVAPGEFFSFDAAGIDPRIGTRSFGGVFATHRNASTPTNYTFDDFSVTAQGGPVSSGEFSFIRSTIQVPSPTSMVWGPDNRLYVTEMLGTIHAITLNATKQVTADQVITTLGSRLTLGITVDPLSTPTNIILWVSHSSPSLNSGALNSSTISRLSGAGFSTRTDVITGLPRAIANHAVNSLHFGPDGKLYIAQGGNTGAGAANQAGTEFGTRAEQPLSAALLVADVRASGFDGTCATAENTYGPAPCNVAVYASGLRNMYDFVWHTNGRLYGPNNGLGVTGTFPPNPTSPCEGFGDPALSTNGGDNPGEQPDSLNLIEQGKYYGHPNPYRNQCVFNDGSYQGVAPLANYVRPIYDLGMNRSANSTIEYKSNTAFSGNLKGQILITNYSVGDDITRIKLSADGRSVVEARQLVGGFNNPLPLVEQPDGTLFVGELGANRITVLRPDSNVLGDTTPPAAPTGLTASSNSSGTAVNLDWTNNTATDLAGYNVYRGTSSTSISSRLNTTLVTSSAFTDSTAQTGTTYHYQVTAVDTSGNESARSGSASASLAGGSTTGTWVTRLAAPVALLDAGGTALGDRVYVVAGKTSSGPRRMMYIYNPVANSWTQGPDLPTQYPAVENPAVVAYNSKLYMFGGSTSAFSGAVTSAAVYNPANSSWTMLAPMPTKRAGATAQAINGKIYVAGGMGPDGTSLSSVVVYDPALNTWSTAAAMSTRRDNAGSAVLDGKLYVFGGRTRDASGAEINGTLASVESLDPATGTWSARASMPTGRRSVVVGTLNGRAQVMGGERKSDGSTFAENQEYDPVSNSWRTLAPMPTPRHGAVAGTINGVVYVITGGPVGGSTFSRANEAFSIP
jgi:large repetitive protein